MVGIALFFASLAVQRIQSSFAQTNPTEAKKPLLNNVKPVGEIDSSSQESGLNAAKKALSPAQSPLPAAAARSPFGGTREPAITPIELDVVRTSDGKLQIRSVDPQSKFASKVKESQVFNNWNEIWTAIGETPEGEETPSHR